MPFTDLLPALAGKSVFIVDDDPESVLFFKETLEQHRVSTILEANLEASWKRLSDPVTRRRVGLVLVDLQMIGQRLPRELHSSYRVLGNAMSGGNTGQALGYRLWQQRCAQPQDWPRYVYMSQTVGLWAPAAKAGEQEFHHGASAPDTDRLHQLFVRDKFARDGIEFGDGVWSAWQAWDQLEAQAAQGDSP